MLCRQIKALPIARLNQPPARTVYIQLETYLPYQLSILSNRVSQGIAATYSQAYDLSNC